MEVGFMDAYVRLLIQTCHKYVFEVRVMGWSPDAKFLGAR